MRKELIILLILFSVFLAIGCASHKGGIPNTTVTPNATITPTTAVPESITVSAATSLTEVFTNISSQFEKENPGTNVSLNFGSSGNLRMQIDGGAPVDVFASADEKQMNLLANKSLIVNSSRKDFAHNSLLLIVPADSDLNITNIKDLTNPKVQKISIGSPDSVPVGEYAKIALTDAGLWSQLENKTVPAGDVKQVLTYVEGGDVDAGFVYVTDTKTAKPGTIKVVSNVPESLPISYPIAVVSASNHQTTAQKFVDFVTGKEGQEFLKEDSFVIQP
jgi:molybdate transport system substrate-binding protein